MHEHMPAGSSTPPIVENTSVTSHGLETPIRRKRPKISLACNNCRYRRKRCDGRQPVCAVCERRLVQSTCVYERPPLDLNRQALDPRRADHVEQLSFNPRYPSRSGLAESHDPAQRREFNGDRSMDGIATVAAGEHDPAVYGSSSTIAFVQHVTDGIQTPNESPGAPRVNSIKPHPGQGGKGELGSHPEITREKDDAAAVFPQRGNADDYLHCYWEFIHPVFPIVHKSSFIKQYERLWLPADARSSSENRFDVDSTIYCSMLNLVFALGCQFSNLLPSSKRASTADEFYQRSRKVFLFEILDSSSLPLVQYLLLQGAYLQSSRYATRCWNVVGLAIRVAQSLGLHLPLGRKGETQLVREMKRRVWHTCVVLDRLLAMTFGRPTMLPDAGKVPIPLVIDDEYLRDDSEDGIQPASVPSRLGLFTSSCKLFEYLGEILKAFYVGESEPQDMIEKALRFNGRLDEFANSVPSYLQMSQVSRMVISEKNSCVSLQQQVLYCRFLYVRLLSLRPLLLHATSRRRQNVDRTSNDIWMSSLDKDLIQRCCNVCVETAHRLIEVIHQHLDTAYKSAGWHSVYFTFAAAVLLLAAQQRIDINVQSTGYCFETSWDRCLSILEHYKEQIVSAPQAIAVLQRLRGQTSPTQPHPHLQGLGNAAGTDNPEGLTDGAPFGIEHMESDALQEFDFRQFNPFGGDCISDAWFGQHLTNLDFFDLDPDIL